MIEIANSIIINKEWDVTENRIGCNLQYELSKQDSSLCPFIKFIKAFQAMATLIKES